MMMAGAEEPATSSGFFNMTPMMQDRDLRSDSDGERTGLRDYLSRFVRLQ
jgi:hypothetical protein